MAPSDHPVAGVDYPRNWHELVAWFPDDAACLRYLERLRWAKGFACRFCGTVDGQWWQMTDGLRRCRACRGETSVTGGHDSGRDTYAAGQLVSWFAAVWYVVNQKQASACWGCSGCWASAATRPRGRGCTSCAARWSAPTNALVAIAVERRDGGPRRTRMRRIPHASKDVLTDFVLDHVARGSEVRTDGLADLPFQPPPLAPPRAAVLPPARAGGGDRTAPPQGPQGTGSRLTRPRLESGEGSGYPKEK